MHVLACIFPLVFEGLFWKLYAGVKRVKVGNAAGEEGCGGEEVVDVE